MKKIIILFIIFLVLLFFLIYKGKFDNNEKDALFKVEFFSTCNKGNNRYYKLNNRNIYTICIKSIYIKDKEKYIDFTTYIELYGLEAIEKLATSKALLKDGGSKIYTFDNSIANNPFQIHNCNNMSGNNNIYLSKDLKEYDLCNS